MATLQEFKAELFKAMANPIRIRILEVLRAEGELSVGEIQTRLGLEPSNVSQHLTILRKQGLIASTRIGTSLRYAIAAPGLPDLLDAARAIFENQLIEQGRLLNSDGARH